MVRRGFLPLADVGVSLDLYRGAAAVYAAAQYLGWRRGGIPVQQVRVWGHGRYAQGYVRTGRQKLDTAGQVYEYLVGLLAGPAADMRWCEEHGIRYHERVAEDDLAAYQRLRQHPMAAPDHVVRAGVQTLVRQHWPEITRLADTLVTRGRL